METPHTLSFDTLDAQRKIHIEGIYTAARTAKALHTLYLGTLDPQRKMWQVLQEKVACERAGALVRAGGGRFCEVGSFAWPQGSESIEHAYLVAYRV